MTSLFDIIAKEVRENIQSRRYLILNLVVITLFVVSVMLFVESYEQKKMRFDSFVTFELERFNIAASHPMLLLNHTFRFGSQPSKLAFVFNGDDEGYPDVVGFSPNSPSRLKFSSIGGSHNPFFAKFIRLDWNFIVGFLLTFSAFVIGHDSITRERETGTLKVILSSNVPRYQVVLAKSVAGWLALVVSLNLGLLLGLLLIVVQAPFALARSDFTKIVIWLLLSLLFLFLHVAVAVAASALCRDSRQSLYILLAIWVTLLLLLPSLANVLAHHRFPTKTSFELENEVQILEETAFLSGGEVDQHEIAALYEGHLRTRVDQVKLAGSLARWSPFGILQDTLGVVFQTGVRRFESQLSAVAIRAAQMHQMPRQDLEYEDFQPTIADIGTRRAVPLAGSMALAGFLLLLSLGLAALIVGCFAIGRAELT